MYITPSQLIYIVSDPTVRHMLSYITFMRIDPYWVARDGQLSLPLPKFQLLLRHNMATGYKTSSEPPGVERVLPQSSSGIRRFGRSREGGRTRQDVEDTRC